MTKNSAPCVFSLIIDFLNLISGTRTEYGQHLERKFLQYNAEGSLYFEILTFILGTWILT